MTAQRGSQAAELDGPDARYRLAATRVAGAAVVVDGVLDDDVWTRAPAVSSFVQSKPREGEPASERTEVRVAFDDRALYIAAMLYDREPERIVATVLRRDQSHADNDAFAVTLDTYHDHQRGYQFETNALGAQYDAQIVGEAGSTVGSSGSRSAFNADWDAVWDVASRITTEGWAVEMVIPFWSLRYDRHGPGTWGINFRRTIRRRSEEAYWAPVPRQYGITRLSLSGLVSGLEGLPAARNVQVKPFAIGGLSDVPASSGSATRDRRLIGDAGVDLKWGITPNLTADVTLNTDFSQVEADDQQINLTRFSLLFPEKREFFLENAGLFDFGGAIGGPLDFPGAGRVIGFHSRRIGISDDNREVPLLGGARLTGQAGPWSLGLLTLQTDDSDVQRSTNYAVGRVRRDFWGRSNVGLIFTNADGGGRENQAVGFDGRLAVSRSLTVDSWWMKTETPGQSGPSSAGHVLVDWGTPRYQFQGSVMNIGEEFNPEVGFVNRRGVRIHDAIFHWTPYPNTRWVRSLTPHAAVTYATDPGYRLLTRNVHLDGDIIFQSNDRVGMAYNGNFEQLDLPFEIFPGVVIPPGAYHFDELELKASTDSSRTVAGSVRHTFGHLYNGEFWRFTGRLTARWGARVAAQLSWTRNDVDLPSGAFVTDLLRLQSTIDFSPRLSLSTLLQYNSRADQFVTNVRLDFIHTPGADLFVVYNERRWTQGAAASGLLDRALIVKLTHLLRL